MSHYQPQPLDTSRVQLPPTLERLLEMLAENTHDVWAKERIAQGWSYGPSRDDVNKKHPCLIPYAELSENEKEFDRKTAGETLKAILLLKYKIQEPK